MIRMPAVLRAALWAISCTLFWAFAVPVLTYSLEAGAAPVERFVEFRGAGGVTLAGLVTLPGEMEEAPFPAVMLLQGSGPTDRNGNQLPHIRTNLLSQIARDLAEAGIASLRFDKRGMNANAAELPEEPEALSAFVAWDNFVADAEMGYRRLAADPDIDNERVGIVGHSEGGLIALDIVQRGEVGPRTLVLLAMPGRPFGEVIADQLAGVLGRQAADEVHRKFLLAEDARIRNAILAYGEVPGDVPAELQALYPGYLGRFYQPLLALDPQTALAGFSGPVLLLSGGRDTQVSPKLDFEPLAGMLHARGDGSAAFLVPGASHNLKPVAAGGNGFEGHIDPAVMDEMTSWLGGMLRDGVFYDR